MSGFGAAPFGVAPYGVGTPATAPEPGGKIHRDEATGAQFGSRKLNKYTKQYEFDDYGRVLGMADVQQMVQIAVSTELGSSAVRNLGHELRTVLDITDNFQRRVQTILESALADLVKRKLVEIITVDVRRVNTSGLYALLRWRDLTTNNEHETTI